MTLVMLAVTPFLAGMGFAISIFMSRNTSLINKAYGGEWRGSLDWLCGRLPHAVGLFVVSCCVGAAALLCGAVGAVGLRGRTALPMRAIMP